MELQSRDQNGVRGREWGRPETRKLLSPQFFQSAFTRMSIPFYRSLSPTLESPAPASPHISKALILLLHWDSLKSQSILIDYSVYVVHSSPKMSYYMNSEFTKDISIIYSWHIVKSQHLTLLYHCTLKACMLGICTCHLSQKKKMSNAFFSTCMRIGGGQFNKHNFLELH